MSVWMNTRPDEPTYNTDALYVEQFGPTTPDHLLRTSVFGDKYSFILIPLSTEQHETLLPVFDAWARAFSYWSPEI